MWLDSSSFPHILNAIIDMVKDADDRPTLMNLRATCMDCPPSPPSFKALLAFIENATVLDLQMLESFEAHMVFYCCDPKIKMKVVRHTTRPSALIRVHENMRSMSTKILASKEVFFIHLKRQIDLASKLWMFFRISDSTQEVVLNITYDPSLNFRLNVADAPEFAHPRLADAQEHLVIIFHTVASAGASRFPPVSPVDDHFAAFAMVLGLIIYSTTLNRKFTVVCLDQVDWRWLGIMHPGHEHQTVEHARHFINRGAERDEMLTEIMASPALKAKIASQLKFVTLDEYKQQVGEREFMLNTVE
ncbi:hypothetical protein Q8F55_007638 [Vanrija albida]|uniref:Fungal-type protein kinase domain-containing protein n=1 Tax=Vanrija albida TaxID=181172 RepID=A0ABR3PU39_9TREE